MKQGYQQQRFSIITFLFLLNVFYAEFAFGAVSVTVPSLTITTASYPSVYNALGNIVIDEGANNDFPIAARNIDYTFTITAPANFEFQAATGSISAIAADITTISMVVTATTITVTYRSSENTSRVDEDDMITISGLMVRAITGPATQNATKTASSETIGGLPNGTIMASFVSKTGCNHTLRLTDTFGDGWNGGTVTVTVNGVAVLTNIALAGMTGPEDFTFSASDGDVIIITRTADGSYPTEMRTELIGGSANTIVAALEPPVAPGVSALGCCTPTVPALAGIASPANGATGQNVCGIALSWNAPVNNGCNNVTSYDVYFGTSAVPPLVTNTTATSYATGTLSALTTYYWKIVPKNAVGSAAGAITWSFTTGATPCSACTHTIRLTDSFGDGWNGGTITVTVNGVAVLTNIALAGMTGPEDFTFAAADGAVINVTRTADGSYPAELRVEILGASSTVILPVTNPVPAPGTTVSGCCSPVVPGCATSPSPAIGASGINPCSSDLTWTAPLITGCNAPTSYDIYFGTSATPPFLINTTATLYALPVGLADNTTYYWQIVPRNAIGAATGCATWSFTTGTSTNPAYCLYGSALNYPTAGSNCVQLTSASSTQNGCAWNRGQISFASAFDYSLQTYFGAAAGGADGCAFVFQNSPQGISQCGSTGGQLGAGGISNAVVVEFDTYDNDFPGHVYDMSVDHTAIEIDGDMNGPGAPLCGPVQADPVDGLLADGLLHTLRVTWDPFTTTLCVYVDGSLRISCVYDYVNNVFGGNPNVWWGFTGSTGLLANQQYFCPVTIPVPVEMMSLTAGCTGHKPILTWYTASETGNQSFKIERSGDGYNFETIRTMAGAGNSNSVMMYQFVDEQPVDGTSYYRLSQTDFDGTVRVLGTVTSECGKNPNELEILRVMQNHPQVTLDFTTSFEGLHVIQITNSNGQIIDQQSMMCGPGNHQADFCINTEPGVYLISITNVFNQKVTRVKL